MPKACQYKSREAQLYPHCHKGILVYDGSQCWKCSGACRHFQPEYEKIAAFFQQRGELQPKIVVARVDCANEVS